MATPSSENLTARLSYFSVARVPLNVARRYPDFCAAPRSIDHCSEYVVHSVYTLRTIDVPVSDPFPVISHLFAK